MRNIFLFLLLLIIQYHMVLVFSVLFIIFFIDINLLIFYKLIIKFL